MNNIFFKVTITIAISLGFLNVYSQHGFIKNIVKIKGTGGEYGFITGANKKNNETFFITVNKESKYSDKLSVLLKLNNSKKDKEGASFSATLVQKPNKISNYFIAVYQINEYLSIETKYYSPTKNGNSKYNIFNDRYREDGERLFDPNTSISTQIQFDDVYNTNLISQSITFPTDKKGEFGLKGTPILDEKGLLKAIIIENQKKYDDGIKALDITAIFTLLSDLGKQVGNPCKYFNLIEQSSYKDETPCEKVERLDREAEEQRKQVLKDRAKQLRQESLKTKFELFESGNREPEVRKAYNMHRDRIFAFSIGGTGFATLLTMSASPDAITSKTNATSFGYSLGGNLYTNPDKGHFRLVFKPRYTYTPFTVSENYKYETTSDFTVTQMNLKTYELTVMPELVFKRLEKGDNFFSVGYGVAKHTSTSFSYKSKDKSYTEPILGYKVYSRHAAAEIGSSRGRIRYSLVVRYELTSYARNNYEFVLNGKSIFPLRDFSKHYWTYGIDFQLRLWNRWKNDYRTMF